VGPHQFRVAVLITKQIPFADELRRKIHNWLSAPDPSSNHNDACKKRQPTTGEWFVGGEEFKQWKSDLNSFIWLYGIRMFCYVTFQFDGA
jgi:hypothetical protein